MGYGIRLPNHCSAVAKRTASLAGQVPLRTYEAASAAWLTWPITKAAARTASQVLQNQIDRLTRKVEAEGLQASMAWGQVSGAK